MKEQLPLHTMERLLRKAGAQRISEEAKEELRRILGKKIDNISEKAIVYSKHAKRKTVKKEDVELALE